MQKEAVRLRIGGSITAYAMSSHFALKCHKTLTNGLKIFHKMMLSEYDGNNARKNGERGLDMERKRK